MLTHRTNAPIIPGTGITLRELEAPAVNGRMFLGGSGWLGFRCGCGFIITARTAQAVQAAIVEHEQPATCAAAAVEAERADEERVE